MYTQDDLKNLINHARLRGIRVIPELEFKFKLLNKMIFMFFKFIIRFDSPGSLNVKYYLYMLHPRLTVLLLL